MALEFLNLPTGKAGAKSAEEMQAKFRKVASVRAMPHKK
jgi:hypothetical protein